jgi:glycosyltransferase involved in cell wall biosynthesis
MIAISVVIPVFNRADIVGRAIDSALAQRFAKTATAVDVIVVDDGSTDHGPAIVRDMAMRFPIRILQKANGGQSSARNLGVKHAHGDLIAFLDQDDAWYPDHLAKLVQPFQSADARDLGWSYSDLDEIDESGRMMMRGVIAKYRPTSHPKRDLMTCLCEDMFILPSASLISRAAFDKVGGFDERLSGYEDDDLFLRLFMAGFNNVFIAQSLSKWRIYQKSSSFSPRMGVSRAIYAKLLIDRFPNSDITSRYYVADLIAPRFFRSMAADLRRIALRKAHAQYETAFANLRFIVNHMRTRHRIPIQLLVLPILRFPGLAQFLLSRREITSLMTRAGRWVT